MKSISIIIPNYNGEEILQETLPTIQQHAQKYGATIIIVDDRSTDGSVKMLKEKFSHITLIEKAKNEGFSATVNIGVMHATTELVCLLNSDIVTTENFLDPILPYFNDSNIFSVGMLDQSDDNESHGRGKFIFERGFLLHKKFTSENNEITSGVTGWVSCGSGVFSKKIWDELGGLDELLNPFYFEDVDIGYRAWKSGYTSFLEEKAIVQHKHKKGSIKSNYQEEKIKTISYRNQIYVAATNLTDSDKYTEFLLTLPKNIAIAIKNNDQAFLKAIFECTKNIKKIQASRKSKSNTFKLSDQKVFEMI